MKLRLPGLVLFCLFSTFLHAQDFENNSQIDPRVLLHYPMEELSLMSEEKLANISYYYCESYTLDFSSLENFDINTFDIVPYEKYRLDNEYKVIEHNGLKITLVPKNLATYLVNFNPKNYRHE